VSWIGLDIGGTRIKGGVLSHDGEILVRAVEATQPDQAPEAFEKQLDALVERLVEQGGSRPSGIGAAITGPVDPARGCIYLPGKIKGLDRHATVPYLSSRWGIPAIADNDGRLACLGEWKLGAGRGIENLVLFTLGTGIGSGVVLDGRLLTDRHFQRGTQCGHGIIDVNGPLCLTGARGTGESLASVTAFVGSVRDHLARGIPSVMSEFPREELSFPQIAEAVRQGDRLAVTVFERWLRLFSAVALNAFYAYAPDRIILGGGPAKAADLFVPRIKALLEEQAFRVPPDRPIDVTVAALGEEAGWMGGALLAREHFGRAANQATKS
jgi:glucokinase